MNQPPRCQLLRWEDVQAAARELAAQLRAARWRPDTLVAIGRGGWIPGRLLSDLLGIMELAGLRIEHYHGSERQAQARVREPLAVDITGRRVLVIDDVSDSGDTFDATLAHLRERGEPTEVRTAVLHHKTTSRFVPDFIGATVEEWRWLTYPWAVVEDVTGFVRAMKPSPAGATAVRERLWTDYGIELDDTALADVMAALEGW